VTLTKTQKTALSGVGTVAGVALSVLVYNLLGSSAPASAAPGPAPSSTAPAGTLIHAPAGFNSVVRVCVDGDGVYISQGSAAPPAIVPGDLACPQLTTFPTAEPTPAPRASTGAA
jgi:hypothetical protein